VTSTVAGQIPQLFSAVLGNTALTSSASATAAVVTQVVDGSLILLNRRKDRTVFGNTNYYGVNLMVQANDNGSRLCLADERQYPDGLHLCRHQPGQRGLPGWQ